MHGRLLTAGVARVRLASAGVGQLGLRSLSNLSTMRRVGRYLSTEATRAIDCPVMCRRLDGLTVTHRP